LLGCTKSIGAYVKLGEESEYIKIIFRGDYRKELITIMWKISMGALYLNFMCWEFLSILHGKKLNYSTTINIF